MSNKQLINRLQNLEIIKNKVLKTTTINSIPLTSDIVLTKNELGLAAVDNTSDADKPLSLSGLNALAAKENISNKNIANGYAGLDNSGKLNLSSIPIDPTFSNMVSQNKCLKFANTSWMSITNSAETTIPLIVVQSNFPLTVSTRADGIFQINLDVGRSCSISGAISVFAGGASFTGPCTSKVYIDGSTYSTKTHTTTNSTVTSSSHQIIYTNPPPLYDSPDNITFHVTVSFSVASNNQARLTAFFYMV